METKTSTDEEEFPQETTTSNEEEQGPPLNRMLFDDPDVPSYQRFFGTNASNMFEDRKAVSKLSAINELT